MGEFYTADDFANEKSMLFPLALISSSEYKDVSDGEAILYCLLKYRLQLSLRRPDKFSDDMGAFIYFKQDELANEMQRSVSTVKRLFSGLVKHGLVATRKQGLGLPQKIYLRRLKAFSESESDTSEVSNPNLGQLTSDTPDSSNPSLGQLTSDTSDSSHLTPPYSRDLNTENRYGEKESESVEKSNTHTHLESENELDNLFANLGLTSTILKKNVRVWLDMRSKRGKPTTGYPLELLIANLKKDAGGNQETMNAMVEEAITQQWMNVYPHQRASPKTAKKEKPKYHVPDYFEEMAMRERSERENGRQGQGDNQAPFGGGGCKYGGTT